MTKPYPIVRGFTEIHELFMNLHRSQTAYIAGSYAAYMAGADSKPKDIDIFVIGGWREANAIVSFLQMRGMKLEKETPFYAHLVPHGWNAISSLPVQVVKPQDHINSADDIIADFDFSVCQAVLIDGEHILGHEGLLDNDVIITKIKTVVNTVRRIAKYTAKGYHFPSIEIFKIVQFWDKLSDERKEKVTQRYYPLLAGEYEDDDMDYGVEDNELE